MATSETSVVCQNEMNLTGETTSMTKRMILIAGLAAACGASTSNLAVDHNRAGSGSSTLAVDANVNVTVSATAPVTNFRVDLTDGLGANVSGATVTVHDAALGDVPLVEANPGSGRYTNMKTAYPSGDMSLTIVKGSDKIQGVVVGYPGTHAINGPAASTTYASTQPLHVSWTTPATAKAATVSTADYSIMVPDTGTYDIPGGNATNPARFPQHVSVARSNQVDIAGGLPGSSVTVTVTARVDNLTIN